MSICTVAIAETINLHWLNDNGATYTESTCTVNDDLIIPTTPPTKYGYTFTGWEILPFVQIEYLESTGTQYIDTGFKISSNNVNIKTIFMPLRVGAIGNRLSGSYNGNLRGFSFYIWNNLTIGCGAKDISTNVPMYVNTVYTLDLQAKDGVLTGTVNGVNVEDLYTNTIVNNLNLYLFKPNESGSYNFHGRIYKYQLYDNDVLVRDFIPALDSNNVPCMYDKVEGKFYYNAGTGQFIAGPVLQ